MVMAFKELLLVGHRTCGGRAITGTCYVDAIWPGRSPMDIEERRGTRPFIVFNNEPTLFAAKRAQVVVDSWLRCYGRVGTY